MLHTPIPWMVGPLVTIAFLRVAGVRIGAPPAGRQIGQWIIGTSLGLYFTPHVVREVGGWWWLLALGALFAIGLGYGGGVLLARLARIDRTTGIFASVPGGAAEMSVLGERFGARVDRVAAAQSLRILIVVLVIPFAYAVLGLHGADPYVPGASQFDGRGLRAADGGDAGRQRGDAADRRAQCVRAGIARGRDSADRDADRPVGDADGRVEHRPVPARLRAGRALRAGFPARAPIASSRR